MKEAGAAGSQMCDWAAPRLSYVICATARTGSSLLADYLTSLGTAGRPDEYFNSRPPRGALRTPAWIRERGRMGPLEYLGMIVTLGQTDNGVFGAKVTGSAFDEALSLMRAGFAPGLSPRRLLDAAFPGLKAIVVTRLDKVAQAVSVLRALESQRFSALDGEGLADRQRLRYSYPLIQMTMEDIMVEERAWMHTLPELGIPFHVVAYEELSAQPEQVVAAVVEFLGIEAHSAPATRLTRQADDLSNSWAHRHDRNMARAHRALMAAASATIARTPNLRRHYWSHHLTRRTGRP